MDKGEADEPNIDKHSQQVYNNSSISMYKLFVQCNCNTVVLHSGICGRRFSLMNNFDSCKVHHKSHIHQRDGANE